MDKRTSLASLGTVGLFVFALLLSGCIQTPPPDPGPSPTPGDNGFSTGAQAGGAYYETESVVHRNVENTTDYNLNTSITQVGVLQAVFVNTTGIIPGDGNGTNVTVELWDWRNTQFFTTGLAGVDNSTFQNRSVNYFVGMPFTLVVRHNGNGTLNGSVRGSTTNKTNQIEVVMVFNRIGNAVSGN